MQRPTMTAESPECMPYITAQPFPPNLTAGDGDFAAPASGRNRLLARNFRHELAVYEAATPEDIAPAIDAASKASAQAMNVLTSPLFSFNSRQVVDRTAVLRLPAIYQWPEIAEVVA